MFSCFLYAAGRFNIKINFTSYTTDKTLKRTLEAMAFLKQLQQKAGKLQKDEHAIEAKGLSQAEKEKIAKEKEAKYGKSKLECPICNAVFYTKIEMNSHQTAHACKILDYLYLGNRINASDPVELTRFKITHVLNCTEDLKNFFENGLTKKQQTENEIETNPNNKDKDKDDEKKQQAPKNDDEAKLEEKKNDKNDKSENKEENDCAFILHPKYLRLPLKDRGADVSLFKKELNSGLTFIENALKENKNAKLFVHCRQGISRSSTMVIAYLMKLHCKDEKQWNFAKTLAFVKDKRDIIQPIHGFQDFLVGLEDEWNIKPKTTKKELEEIEKAKGIFIDNDMDLNGNRIITDPKEMQNSAK